MVKQLNQERRLELSVEEMRAKRRRTDVKQRERTVSKRKNCE
jgi:hypothetical protein